jgi:hypothetical protein
MKSNRASERKPEHALFLVMGLGLAIATCLGSARKPATLNRDKESESLPESVTVTSTGTSANSKPPGGNRDWPNIREAPAFDGVKSIPLPGSAVDAIEGGSGRFLILKLESPKSLVVFDANALDIVKILPLNDTRCLLAAGRDVLIAVDPNTGTCQRWSLRTWEQAATIELAVELPIQSVALGSASTGPLLVVQDKDRKLSRSQEVEEWPSPFVRFFNVDDLKPVLFKLHVTRAPRLDPANRGNASASADGTTFVLDPFRTCLRICDDTLVVRRIARSTSTTPTLPGPDGQMIYGMSSPRFFNWMPLGANGGSSSITAFPATQSPYFITQESSLRFNSRAAAKRGHWVSVMAPGEVIPIFSVKHEMRGPRCHFLSASKVFVCLESATRDRIDLFYVDVQNALRKRTEPYLYFTSSPPLQTRPGTKFRYAAGWVSSQNGVNFELDKPPDGMTVDANGVVEWNVPQDHPAGYIDFRLVARLAPGLERQQWISLYCHESR